MAILTWHNGDTAVNCYLAIRIPDGERPGRISFDIEFRQEYGKEPVRTSQTYPRSDFAAWLKLAASLANVRTLRTIAIAPDGPFDPLHDLALWHNLAGVAVAALIDRDKPPHYDKLFVHVYVGQSETNEVFRWFVVRTNYDRLTAFGLDLFRELAGAPYADLEMVDEARRMWRLDKAQPIKELYE